MIEFLYGRSKYQCAEHWAELNDKQRLRLIVFSRLKPNEITEDIEKLVCRLWLGVSDRNWMSWRLSRWQWGQLKKQFGWIFSTRPEGKPADNFTHKGITYLLPDDNYAQASALEVALLNLCFTEFARPDDPDPTALDRLIAILCRPVRADLKAFRVSDAWNGDAREVWNEPKMLERSKALSDLELPLKVAILDYFERMNNPFLEQYSALFGGGSKEPRYGDGLGWVMMLKNIAKTGMFGDFDRVCHQPVHLVWASVLDEVIDQKEAEENQKRYDRN